MSDHRIVAIYEWPIKGTRPQSVERAILEPSGFRGDRQFVLVDEKDKFIRLGKKSRKLTTILPTVEQTSNGRILAVHSTASGGSIVFLPDVRPPLPREVLDIWGKSGGSFDLGDGPAEWFTDQLGLPCRLRVIDPTDRRQANIKKAGNNIPLNGQDGAPVHIVCTASVRAIAEAAGYPTDPESLERFTLRFRPNIVIETKVPFEEDGWTEVMIGSTLLACKWPSDRCEVPGFDPYTGDFDRRVIDELARLRTLKDLVAAHRLDRRWLGVIDEEKSVFGWFLNLLAPSLAVVNVTDPVFIPRSS